MKVTFLSVNDWANLGYNFARAMKSIGINAKAFTVNYHVFGYPEQADPFIESMVNIVLNSDIIIFMHSQFVDIGWETKAKFWVFHGGTAYRKYTEQCNQFFNQFVTGTLIQDAVLLGHGAKNEHWVMPPVDTDYIRPKRSGVDDVINIGHFPSGKFDIKGTEIIKQTMETITAKYPRIRFLCSTEQKRWTYHIERIRDCDVYIDQIHPDIPKYGSWGVSALEAASSGCIVIASFKGKELYESEFGPCPIRVAQNAFDLESHISEIASMSKPELIKERKAFRDWVMAYHSYKYVGERLRRILS